MRQIQQHNLEETLSTNLNYLRTINYENIGFWREKGSVEVNFLAIL